MWLIVSLLVRLWVEMPVPVGEPVWCMSASSWGCELKFLQENALEGAISVSLLVRLWVEMVWTRGERNENIRQPPREAVSWNVFHKSSSNLYNVSLLVRLWVEILPHSPSSWDTVSASSWGCELKYSPFPSNIPGSRQPPREAVSWNIQLIDGSIKLGVSLLVRLWVEIPFFSLKSKSTLVSLLVRLWVEIFCMGQIWRQRQSASSWGCELKYLRNRYEDEKRLSASSWGCELKYRDR